MIRFTNTSNSFVHYSSLYLCINIKFEKNGAKKPCAVLAVATIMSRRTPTPPLFQSSPLTVPDGPSPRSSEGDTLRWRRRPSPPVPGRRCTHARSVSMKCPGIAALPPRLPDIPTAHAVVSDYAQRTFSAADAPEPLPPAHVLPLCCPRLAGPALDFAELPDRSMHWSRLPIRRAGSIQQWAARCICRCQAELRPHEALPDGCLPASGAGFVVPSRARRSTLAVPPVAYAPAGHTARTARTAHRPHGLSNLRATAPGSCGTSRPRRAACLGPAPGARPCLDCRLGGFREKPFVPMQEVLAASRRKHRRHLPEARQPTTSPRMRSALWVRTSSVGG